MAREKIDNKLNVVIGTKAQIEGDSSIPENSIIIATDEELKAEEIVYSAEKNVKEAIEDKVSTSDIVDDLVSSDVDKPLSANQGKVLNDTTAKLAVSNVFTQPQQVPNATLPQHTTNLSQVETMFEMFKQQLRGYNFAMPDLSTATDLGNGVYNLYNNDNDTADYNVFNGNFILNKVAGIRGSDISFNILEVGKEYTLTYTYISGVTNEFRIVQGTNITQNFLIADSNYKLTRTITFIANYEILTVAGNSFIERNDFTFKLQLEKGSTATPYTLPGQIPQYKIVGEE